MEAYAILDLSWRRGPGGMTLVDRRILDIVTKTAYYNALRVLITLHRIKA